MQNTDEKIYKGYKEIVGDTAYINQYMEDIQIDGYKDWNINEYLILRNTDDNSESEMRFDGERFVGLKLPPSRVMKARNALQRCALDILNNKDITIAAIIGKVGSGKSIISTRMSCYSVLEKGWRSKIVCVRSPVSYGKSLGYLKGSFDDKFEAYTLPIQDQLDGGFFELESLKQRGVLEFNIPFYIKGRTLIESEIIVEEAEDLTEQEIKLIGTRVGENSRIILNGDNKQSVNNITTSNPLIKMCNELKGNSLFACIYLEEDVRSKTSKIFADLFY